MKECCQKKHEKADKTAHSECPTGTVLGGEIRFEPSVGCEEHFISEGWWPRKAKFDCTTRDGWNKKKTKWCCNKRGVCDAHDKYDCTSKEVFTKKKAKWCCKKKQIGCRKSTACLVDKKGDLRDAKSCAKMEKCRFTGAACISADTTVVDPKTYTKVKKTSCPSKHMIKITNKKGEEKPWKTPTVEAAVQKCHGMEECTAVHAEKCGDGLYFLCTVGEDDMKSSKHHCVYMK